MIRPAIRGPERTPGAWAYPGSLFPWRDGDSVGTLTAARVHRVDQWIAHHPVEYITDLPVTERHILWHGHVPMDDREDGLALQLQLKTLPGSGRDELIEELGYHLVQVFRTDYVEGEHAVPNPAQQFRAFELLGKIAPHRLLENIRDLLLFRQLSRAFLGDPLVQGRRPHVGREDEEGLGEVGGLAETVGEPPVFIAR